jgi:hypothetical protein
VQCYSNLGHYIALRNLDVRIVAVGSAVLFSSDVLRNQLGPQDPNPKASSSTTLSSFLSQINSAPTQSTFLRSTLRILPSLLRFFVEYVRKYRTVIFQVGQAESRISPKSQVKQAGMDFLLMCFNIIETTSRKTEVRDFAESCWKAKLELFLVMEGEALYQTSDTKGREFVISQAVLAVELLCQSNQG